MTRTDRLYALMEELRAAAPRPVTVPALARRLEVSERIVQRDLKALAETGAPVYSATGRGGGWSADPAMTLPPRARPPPPPWTTSLRDAEVGRRRWARVDQWLR